MVPMAKISNALTRVAMTRSLTQSIEHTKVFVLDGSNGEDLRRVDSSGDDAQPHLGVFVDPLRLVSADLRHICSRSGLRVKLHVSGNEVLAHEYLQRANLREEAKLVHLHGVQKSAERAHMYI